MGTVVHFQSRQAQAEAAAKTEAILTKIGELYERKQKAKEELPGVLAQLALAGESEFVLKALVEWGTGQSEPYLILAQCEQYAAAAGIKPVGDRPF